MSKAPPYEPASVEIHCPDEVDRTVSLAEGVLCVDGNPAFTYTNPIAEFAVSVLMSKPDEAVDLSEFDDLDITSSNTLSRGFITFNNSVLRGVLYPPVQVLRNKKNTVAGYTLHTSLEALHQGGVKFTYEGSTARPKTAEDRIMLTPLEQQVRDLFRDTKGTAHTAANIAQVLLRINPDKTEKDVMDALTRLYRLQDREMGVFSDFSLQKGKDNQWRFGSKSESE
jgi:hypothetical protein